MRVAIQHRLCSIDPTSLDHLNLSGVQHELCRLSAFVYSDLVLFPIPEPTSIRPPLLYELGRCLDKYEHVGEAVSTSAAPDFLAWVVLLAAAASTANPVFHSQYVKRLRDLLCKDPRLSNWEFYKGLVRRYIWWDYLLDPLAWEAFSAASS